MTLKQGPASGKPLSGQPTEKERARFDVKVDKSGEHWMWTSAYDDFGYPRVGLRKAVYPAHRVSLWMSGTEIPAGMCVDHICRVRGCVNPAHLRVVTPAVNARENNESPFAMNRRKTHCIHGHEFTPENTRYYTPKYTVNFRGKRKPGVLGRVCIACQLRRREEARQRRSQSRSK